jgi:diguanylate cyclase (GGDEF)-like protein
LIQQNLRPHDIFGRFGGDEFAIILPNTTLDQGLTLAERLRKLVETLTFEFDEHEIQITASFGVTNYIPETSTFEKLVPYADKALYLSKQQGWNQITHFSPPGELGTRLES